MGYVTKGISVAMCIYMNDNPKHVKEAMSSIFEQTLIPDEVVIVADGPLTKDLEDVLNGISTQSVVRIVRLEKNRGHGEARKVALESCTHEYVAIADADDINKRDRFELEYAFLESNQDISVVGSNILEFIETPRAPIGVRAVPEYHQMIIKYMKSRCPLNQASVMFRKIDVLTAGSYIDWYHNEDYYLWLRMMLKGYKFHNIQRELVYVRVDDNTYSRRGGHKYFLSEVKLQLYMLHNKVVSLPQFALNTSIRFLVQIVMSNRMRELFFGCFARKKAGKDYEAV